jgi:hypothetical protein
MVGYHTIQKFLNNNDGHYSKYCMKIFYCVVSFSCVPILFYKIDAVVPHNHHRRHRRRRPVIPMTFS